MASILTTVGRNKLASATPEQQLTISHIAVGDGNGDFPPLNPSMTSLVNEVWRGAASQPIRTADLGTLIFEGFIPGNIGGFFIREIAIFDNTGAMIAIGQTSVVEKPDPSSGSVVTIAPRLHVKLDNADQVDLIVQDVPYIDHAGLSNRSAADSHPATAISVDALPAIGFNNPTTVQAALSALKSAATKESQSSKTDAVANKLMLTGAFGLGGEAIAISNWNNINVSGFYTNSTSNQTELPIAALPLSLIHIQAGTNATQICGRTASDEPQMWRRSKENGTWGAWVEFADQRYRFISDANLAVKSGLYSLPLSAGALNAPIPNASGTLLVIQGGSGENFVSQMWTQSSDLTTERVFVRHKTSSGWTAWVELIKAGDNIGLIGDPDYRINLPYIAAADPTNPPVARSIRIETKLASTAGKAAFVEITISDNGYTQLSTVHLSWYTLNGTSAIQANCISNSVSIQDIRLVVEGSVWVIYINTISTSYYKHVGVTYPLLNRFGLYGRPVSQYENPNISFLGNTNTTGTQVLPQKIYSERNMPLATQAEAEGVSTSLLAWSPLRVRQAISFFASDFLFTEAKANKESPIFVFDGSSLKTQQSFAVKIGSTVVKFNSNLAVNVPSLSAATDYKIFALSNGTIVAQSWDSTVPQNSKLVGGFHAAYSNGAIVERSIWDFGWRPKCNPRAMVLSLSNRVWADIYLMDTDYGLNGYSRPNAQIADGNSLPIRPLIYGGNGASTYTSFTQYVAKELCASAGKRLPNMADFEDIAYGTVTGQAAGVDPVTTKYQAGLRSAIGCEQVTGTMWQWGSEVWDRGNGSTGYAWYAADADGKGQVYSGGSQAVGAVLVGAYWDNSGYTGACASSWNTEPWTSADNVGARGLCEHTIGGF